MLEYIDPFMPIVPGRAMNRYQQYLTNIRHFFTKHYARFRMGYGHEHLGIALMRQILNNVDYTWLQKNNNDITGYLNHLRFIKNDLDNVFNPVSTGRSFKHHFFSKRLNDVAEYLCPIEDTNCLQYLPFGEPWEKWKSLRPVRIWYHDGPEFTLNILNDRVNYQKQAPNYAVILIDVVALAMKYYKWKYENGQDEETRDAIDLTQQFFLHKYVICPLMYDLVDIWLLQQIKDITGVMDMGVVSLTDYNDVMAESQYGQVGIRYQDGMLALFNEMQAIERGALLPNAFLNSHLLFTSSIAGRVKLAVDRWTVPSLRQYEYMDILKDMDLLRICLSIHTLNSKLPNFKNIVREMRIQYKRMHIRKPWSKCGNRHIASIVEDKVLEFGNDFFLM